MEKIIISFSFIYSNRVGWSFGKNFHSQSIEDSLLFWRVLPDFVGVLREGLVLPYVVACDSCNNAIGILGVSLLY